MVSLKVSTAELRTAARRCRVGAAQVAIAAECHREASRLEFAEDSLLAELKPGHEAFADLVQRRLEKASTVLTNSAHALAEAARMYDASGAHAAGLLESEATS